MNASDPRIRIEMLPARHGDALLVSYGPELRYRMLIDAGPAPAWEKIRPLIDAGIPPDRRVVDLLVITHVDTDHIEGVLKLLHGDQAIDLTFGDIWFNDYDHLMNDRPVDRGGIQGAYLGALLSTRPWNLAWDRQAVRLYDDGSSPAFGASGTDFETSETFTLLSPTRAKAQRMAKEWSAACSLKGLPLHDVDKVLAELELDARYRGGVDVPNEPRPVGKDGSAPNGSSIAFLFESGGRSVLFTGDAHAQVLADSIGRLCAERKVPRLRLDAFKLSHHGSRGNINQNLLNVIDCDTFLVSTNGDSFKHPDIETIDLITKDAGDRRPTIWFNYESEFTTPYRQRANIDVRYGVDGYAVVDVQ